MHLRGLLVLTLVVTGTAAKADSDHLIPYRIQYTTASTNPNDAGQTIDTGTPQGKAAWANHLKVSKICERQNMSYVDQQMRSSFNKQIPRLMAALKDRNPSLVLEINVIKGVATVDRQPHASYAMTVHYTDFNGKVVSEHLGLDLMDLNVTNPDLCKAGEMLSDNLLGVLEVSEVQVNDMLKYISENPIKVAAPASTANPSTAATASQMPAAAF